MGKGVFSNPDGCGRGEGIVHLRITYTPFNMFLRHPADSVTVRAPPRNGIVLPPSQASFRGLHVC